VGGQVAALQPLREPGGPQGRSGRVRKISSPPGFDPRTVQPVASRYTGHAILYEHTKLTQSKNAVYIVY
jgi:hypothetical protein